MLKRPQFTMYLSTGDQKTGIILYNSLMTNWQRSYPLENGNQMHLVEIAMEQEKMLADSSQVFRLIAPLCVREHNKDNNKDYYYSINHEQFIEKLKIVLKNQIADESYLNKQMIDELLIEPINCRKTVVRYKEMFIECTIGQLGLVGQPELLQYLYQNGCGSKRSAGFGFLS